MLTLNQELLNNKQTTKKSSIRFRDWVLYLSCFLFLINIEGPDPIDFLILPVLILYVPAFGTIFRKLMRKLLAVAGVILFISFYIISIIVGGAQISFVVNLILNLTLSFILMVAMNDSLKTYRLIFILSLGFTLAGCISFLQHIYDIPRFPGQFEIIRDQRFMSLFGDPNILGAFSIFILIYWLNEFIYPKNNVALNRMRSATFLFSACFQLLFSLSRSAWLGASLALAVYLLMIFNRKKLLEVFRSIIYFVIVLMVVSAFIFNTELGEILLQRMTSISQPSSEAESDRFGFFYTLSAIRVAFEHPFGVGPGMTSLATGVMSLDGDPIGAHNSFVQIFSDNGWITGVIFLSFVLRLLYRSIIGGFIGQYKLGVSESVISAVLIGQFICGMFQDLVQWRLMWFVPTLYVAMLLSTNNHKNKFLG